MLFLFLSVIEHSGIAGIHIIRLKNCLVISDTRTALFADFLLEFLILFVAEIIIQIVQIIIQVVIVQVIIRMIVHCGPARGHAVKNASLLFGFLLFSFLLLRLLLFRFLVLLFFLFFLRVRLRLHCLLRALTAAALHRLAARLLSEAEIILVIFLIVVLVIL